MYINHALHISLSILQIEQIELKWELQHLYLSILYFSHM